jgi:hypothetical protein
MGIPCRDIETELVCFVTAAGVAQSLVAHYEYRKAANGNTVLHAVRYTAPDGTPVATAGGTVTAGACALPAPDVEWDKLCDVSAAGVVTEFWRRVITTWNSAGVATNTVADFQLDKSTAYVPAGTVGACDQDCDAVAPVGLVAVWG